MLRIALERGLSSMIAKWMLEGRADSVLDRVVKSGALPPEEIAALRAQTTTRLQQVRDEGAPYADMIAEALGGVRAALPDLATILRSADGSNARVVAAAVADELARRASGAARVAAKQWPSGGAADGATADATDAASDATPAKHVTEAPAADPAVEPTADPAAESA